LVITKVVDSFINWSQNVGPSARLGAMSGRRR